MSPQKGVGLLTKESTLSHVIAKLHPIECFIVKRPKLFCGLKLFQLFFLNLMPRKWMLKKLKQFVRYAVQQSYSSLTIILLLLGNRVIVYGHSPNAVAVWNGIKYESANIPYVYVHIFSTIYVNSL